MQERLRLENHGYILEAKRLPQKANDKTRGG